ncbi:MAG: flagellar basal body rod protein FlgC [Phycisphaerae bacterium]|nr:flagellar basal body rod protein FlgC [Phycisphaerae bacterium]MDW8263039.1 flagellar basal body rod protein FlgC [Phycisphaerales bacterium]
MFTSLDIGASALAAHRTRMDTIASNVANISVTRSADGRIEPFRRRMALLAPQADAAGSPGVRVAQIVADPSPFRSVYEPGHPDADEAGYVKYPNIDLAMEMVNMMEASRAYEASVTMMETTKAMLNSSLRLIA